MDSERYKTALDNLCRDLRGMSNRDTFNPYKLAQRFLKEHTPEAVKDTLEFVKERLEYCKTLDPWGVATDFVKNIRPHQFSPVNAVKGEVITSEPENKQQIPQPSERRSRKEGLVPIGAVFDRMHGIAW